MITANSRAGTETVTTTMQLGGGLSIFLHFAACVGFFPSFSDLLVALHVFSVQPDRQT